MYVEIFLVWLFAVVQESAKEGSRAFRVLRMHSKLAIFVFILSC